MMQHVVLVMLFPCLWNVLQVIIIEKKHQTFSFLQKLEKMKIYQF